MAFVEPEYQGVKEKRKKRKGDSKDKENFFHCSFPLPPRRRTFPLSSRALRALHMTEIPFPFPFERLPGLGWLGMHALPCVVTELGCYVLVSQLYLIGAISGSCDDGGYVVSNQLFDVFVFVTGIRECRTYSDMWRTYQQNGWPSIVRGTASDWSMVFVSRRVVKMYYSEVAFQGICWTDTLHLN